MIPLPHLTRALSKINCNGLLRTLMMVKLDVPSCLDKQVAQAQHHQLVKVEPKIRLAYLR